MDAPAVLTFLFFILMLSMVLGFELISKVPATPAHSADVRLQRHLRHHHRGGADCRRHAGDDTLSVVLGTLAVTLATINVVGWYWSPIGCSPCFAKRMNSRAHEIRG